MCTGIAGVFTERTKIHALWDHCGSHKAAKQKKNKNNNTTTKKKNIVFVCLFMFYESYNIYNLCILENKDK